MNQYDIVIVGAGTIGLVLSASLAKQGFSIALIERQPFPTLFSITDPVDHKVFAITRASELLFKRAGCWENIIAKRLCAYQHMNVWDGELDGKISFFAGDYFEPNLGYIIEQSVINSSILESLRSYPNVTIIQDNIERIDNSLSDGVQLLLTETELKAKLVVACDGAHSKMRSMCNISITQWDYHQSAVVATIQTQRAHQNTAYQRFRNDGPLALLPLFDPNQCSIVWTTTTANAQHILSLEDSAFNALLTQESEQTLGKLSIVGKAQAYPLKTHHVKSYFSNRVVFVGDSAHTLHPLAGQGVNLGLLDVSALSQLLIKAKEEGKDFGNNALLKQYEAKRRNHNQIMIWSMEFFKRCFSSQIPLIQGLRSFGLNFVDKQKLFKQFFVKMALGAKYPYPYN